jgi:cyanophycin synthetase
MQILSVRPLRGPNIWSRRPALEALVDLRVLRDSSSEVLPGFNDRLMTWLPGLIEHRCSVGERGGFHTRLRRGTYLAHILEHVTLELQTLVGCDVGFGRARETTREGIYKVAIRYDEESVGLAALETAHRLLLAAIYDLPFDLVTERKKLAELADRIRLGPSTQAIVTAARARDIPAQRLNAGSLVQLGYGAKQRRIWTAETDHTSAIAESIARDKDLTKALLHGAGVPVPEGRQVESRDDAIAAADEIDGSVVVKPLDANHGRGVFMDLRDPDLIAAAYDAAAKEGSGVLVEQFIPGHEHRLLVVKGRMVAAVRGEAAVVTGDGVQTIAALIEQQINADPRRGDDESCPLNPVLLDALTLTELRNQGHAPQDVLRGGERIVVRRNDNLSEDVTELVHPSVAEHAVVAAQVVGLDIAGIDLVVNDVSQALESQGGAIVEVNAGPGLLPHLRPRLGKSRPVGDAIVESLFPERASGRIPIVAVTGTNGKTTTTRLVAAMLQAAGHQVGIACTDGVFVEGRVIDRGDCAGPQSARKVLRNPLVTAAVLECARGGILREGLGFDKCDVAIVTNIDAADHLGGYDLHTPEDMFKVKRCPVDVVLPQGAAVLNARDPLVAKMADLSTGGVIFFGLSPEHPVLDAQRAKGQRAVFVRQGQVVLSQGLQETPLIDIAAVPCTHGGRVPFQIENVLAAVAAAWQLDLPQHLVREALLTFQGNPVDNPARFNVWESGGKTVIVFDGRNVSALDSLITALDRFPAQKRVVVYSAENDRRPADIVSQGQRLGTAFDVAYLCHIESSPTLVAASSIQDLLIQGLHAAESHGANRGREVHRCDGWDEAVDAAWRRLQPGELLVVQSTTVAATVRKLTQLVGR